MGKSWRIRWTSITGVCFMNNALELNSGVPNLKPLGVGREDPFFRSPVHKTHESKDFLLLRQKSPASSCRRAVQGQADPPLHHAMLSHRPQRFPNWVCYLHGNDRSATDYC